MTEDTEATEKGLLEDEKRFATRQKELWAKHPGATLRKGWFTEVQNNHQQLRKVIGGIRLVKTISLDEGQAKADKKVCQPLINELKKITPMIGTRLGFLGLDDDALLSPTINTGSHNVLRTGKAINQWANQDYYVVKSSEKLKQVNKIVSDLGNQWARARCEKVEYQVNLSTAAMAFMLLGHYLVDDDSCFKNGGCNHHHKHILGSTTDTYVMLVKQNDKVISRCWGFASSGYTVFNTTNLYLGKGVLEGNILNAKKVFFADLLQKDPKEIEIHENKAEIGYDDDRELPYMNDYGVFSFAAKKEINTQTLDVDGSGPESSRCPNCGEQFDDREGWQIVDGDMSCVECVSDSTRLSDGTYTLCDTVSLKHPKGKTTIIREDDLPHDSFECSECGLHCVKEILGAAVQNDYGTWSDEYDVCRGCLRNHYRKVKGEYVRKTAVEV